MVYQRHDNSLAFDQECIKERLCSDYVYVIMKKKHTQKKQQKNVLIPQWILLIILNQNQEIIISYLKFSLLLP